MCIRNCCFSQKLVTVLGDREEQVKGSNDTDDFSAGLGGKDR
jgi:hypothetical protein